MYTRKDKVETQYFANCSMKCFTEGWWKVCRLSTYCITLNYISSFNDYLMMAAFLFSNFLINYGCWEFLRQWIFVDRYYSSVEYTVFSTSTCEKAGMNIVKVSFIHKTNIFGKKFIVKFFLPFRLAVMEQLQRPTRED
jgi:hypothetical protein